MAKVDLEEFKKYDPRKFKCEPTNTWTVVEWVNMLEKLFEDLVIEEHERIYPMQNIASRTALHLVKKCATGSRCECSFPSYS